MGVMLFECIGTEIDTVLRDAGHCSQFTWPVKSNKRIHIRNYRNIFIIQLFLLHLYKINFKFDFNQNKTNEISHYIWRYLKQTKKDKRMRGREREREKESEADKEKGREKNIKIEEDKMMCFGNETIQNETMARWRHVLFRRVTLLPFETL